LHTDTSRTRSRVRAAGSFVALLGLATAAFAQAPAARPPSEPFRITDNSFLVEEAFNQEAGVFQNIFGAMRVHGDWTETFTQEWPAPSQTHQLSYTVAFENAGAQRGFGDTLINYRYQASLEGPGRAAFSPRLSLILPTGDHGKGLGNGSLGLQTNLPVSKQVRDWYLHWNGGLTWLPGSVSPFIAGSAIYRAAPMLHLMLESVVSSDETAVANGTVRNTTFTISPGVRGGWNLGNRQIVTGFAMPISWSEGTRDTAAFVYFSYELPFKK
jgi:hypothetical protein